VYILFEHVLALQISNIHNLKNIHNISESLTLPHYLLFPDIYTIVLGFLQQSDYGCKVLTREKMQSFSHTAP
jgi:hypothetical protein